MPAKKNDFFEDSKISSGSMKAIAASRPLILAVKDMPAVEKVVISETVTVRPGRQHIKVQDVEAGLKVTVRGGILLQVLFVYTTERQAVKGRIEQTWIQART